MNGRCHEGWLCPRVTHRERSKQVVSYDPISSVRTHSRAADLEKRNHMYTTHNSLPEEQRAKLVELLNRRLADSIDRMLQARQAH